MKRQIASALAGITLIGAATVLTGCASTSVDKEKYTKDGVTYGDVGPFRGRWWNYYERGRSYLDGEYFAEAEDDLRTALAKRTKDQRWARTYGLHFVPEYFPNRELGVALYSQGNHSEAIQLLEESYQQTPSARAAYYLELSRAELVKDTDQSAPTITFASDLGQANRDGTSMVLRATATDDTYIKAIRVDGEIYPVEISAPSVEIRKRVKFAAATDSISITAIDVTGKETTTNFSPDVEGPAISFNGPVTIPGTVTGVAYDLATVDRMIARVQDEEVEATITRQPDDTFAFSIEVPATAEANPVIFEVYDSLGNVTRGPIPVTTVVNARIANPGVVFASDNRIVPINAKFNAIMRNGEVVAVTLAQANPNELSIECKQNGLNYRLEEIILGIRAFGPNPIKSIDIDGVPVTNLVPGRREQSISRRIALLNEGANSVTVTVTDNTGKKVTEEYSFNRVLTPLDFVENKLNIAMVGSFTEATIKDIEEEADHLDSAVPESLSALNRFRILNRSQINEIIEEQMLSNAFGDRASRAALGQIVPSEVLVIGKIHKSFDSIEIILQAIDPVSTRVVGLADVAGPYDPNGGSAIDQLDALAQDLALRFYQLFPLAKGEIEDTRSNGRLVTTLDEQDGIRQYLKCVVYRKGAEEIDERTGDSLGAPIEIISEGYFDDVQNDISLLLVSEGEEEPIQVSDYVATK